MISLGLGPPCPSVLPEGFDIHPGVTMWWMEAEARYRRRMAVQFTPAVRFFEGRVTGRFTCDNLHPNIPEGEQCCYCGTASEFHVADFDSEDHMERWLRDSWNTHGPRGWKVGSWAEAKQAVLSCPAGTYQELCHLVNSELRAKYGAVEFPPEQDDPLAEQMRAEEKARWAKERAEWEATLKSEADEMWADYDWWEEQQRRLREGTP